jgi:hypothetical protein
MNIFDGLWLSLFFLVSGVMSVLISHRGKKAREKKIEYFNSIPDITEEKNQR